MKKRKKKPTTFKTRRISSHCDATALVLAGIRKLKKPSLFVEI